MQSSSTVVMQAAAAALQQSVDSLPSKDSIELQPANKMCESSPTPSEEENKETNIVIEAPPPPPEEKECQSPQRTRFSFVEIREYPQRIGDCEVEEGIPITISWNHKAEKRLSVDEYELQNPSSQRAGDLNDLYLTPSERKTILLSTGRYSSGQLRDYVDENNINNDDANDNDDDDAEHLYVNQNEEEEECEYEEEEEEYEEFEYVEEEEEEEEEVQSPISARKKTLQKWKKFTKMLKRKLGVSKKKQQENDDDEYEYVEYEEEEEYEEYEYVEEEEEDEEEATVADQEEEEEIKMPKRKLVG